MSTRSKTFIIGVILVCLLLNGVSVFAQPKNRLASAQSVNCWRIRNTSHFQIMDQEKYIDAEEVYRDLSRKLNLRLKYTSPKTKIFIREGDAYTDLSKRKIMVANKRQLRHELTRLLLYQSSNQR